MIERDFEGKKQMPQVATTLTKNVQLSVVGNNIIYFYFVFSFKQNTVDVA
jgi:hypothetical protein